MSFSRKEFLSFEEVAEYLTSQGYPYSLDSEHGYNRLRDLILDLHHERKLAPVFYYCGWGAVTVVNQENLEVIDSGEVYLRSYFCVVEAAEILRKLFKDRKYIDIKQYHCYHYSLKDIARLPIHGDDASICCNSTSLTTVEVEVGEPSFFVGVDDFRYARKVFDKFFNIDNLDEQSQKSIEVSSQPTQANAEIIALRRNTVNDISYTTPAIDIMNEVIKEFWISYNPDQPAPKQSTITKWITDNFDNVSDALALNIDKVCRHSDAKSGGQYKR